MSGQLYVVDIEDRKSGKVSAVYVFNNHDAALRCLRELNMDSNHLRGCVVFSGWENGQPIGRLSKSDTHQVTKQRKRTMSDEHTPLPPHAVTHYRLFDDAAAAEAAYFNVMYERFAMYLADRYGKGEMQEIAHLCDNLLDRSGRLLGRVREIARSDPLRPRS